MKPLASYAFTATREPNGVAAATTLTRIDAWLASKGTINPDGTRLLMPLEREARIEREEWRSRAGNAWQIALSEPFDDETLLRTVLLVGETTEQVAVSIRLSAARSTLAPFRGEVYTPRIVKELLQPPSPWWYAGVPLAAVPLPIRGSVAGARFGALLWDDDRVMPVVAVSEDASFPTLPGIAEQLAGDLAGLALVAELDEAASEQLTLERGRGWSCYAGAIRLYWPGLHPLSSPESHPTWSHATLTAGGDSQASAAERIRRPLRRAIFEQSALGVGEPSLFAAIRETASWEERERFEALKDRNDDTEATANEILEEATRLDMERSRAFARIRELEAENADLRRNVRNLLQARRWHPDDDADDLAPDAPFEPASLQEAVERARLDFDGELTFGADVTRGIESVAADAGPPKRIYEYLQALSELTRARRMGSLGMDALLWLERRNVDGSGESDTIMNAPHERRRRSWDDGTGRKRTFSKHLKPGQGTTTDRCVRIYFDDDPETRKTVIGWVGRHP
jgi:hypothetical protein